MAMSKRLSIVIVTALVVAAGCGDDDDESATSTTVGTLDAGSAAPTSSAVAEPSSVPAASAPPAAAPDGEIPTIRIGWGLAGDELKYARIGDPSLAPNEGTCYETEYIQFPGSSAATQALAAGELDTTISASLTVANAVEQGAELIITSGILNETAGYYTTTWMVPNDSPITAADGVRGTTIGTSGIGNSTDYLAQVYLEDQAGIVAPGDYTIVEVPYAQQEEALGAGQIDVGVFAQPFYGRAAGTGAFRPLFSVSDMFEDFVQLVEIFSADFAAEHPEAVACWIEDQQTMHDWINDPANRDRFLDLTAEVTTIPIEALGYLLTEDDYFRPEANVLDVEGLQEAWDFFAERGGISSELQVDDVIDPELRAT